MISFKHRSPVLRTKVAIAYLLLAGAFTACKKDKDKPEPELPKPKIENLELGLANSQYGVIGEDFHFEANITAGEKIDLVEVRILQRAAENYSKVWEYEIMWEQYKGLKNTNIHKHFDIPGDAPEGKYDFVVIVSDENGTKEEVKTDFKIYSASNKP